MMVGDTYFCGHVSRPTAGRCNECAQVRANAKPLRKLAPSNSKSEDSPLGQVTSVDDLIKDLRTENSNSSWQEYCDEVEAKINRLITEARLNERKELALDCYQGQTFSESTNWEAKFDKFVKNNERRMKELGDSNE